jgi:hypothetical protein
MRPRQCILPLLVLLLLAPLSGCAGKSTRTARLQDLGNGICQDTVSGLMWQKERSRSTDSLAEAQHLARTLELGGYRDWRLPTVQELYDLHHLFDLHQAGGCAMELQGRFWSGENEGEGRAGAWEIGDQCEPQRRYFSGQRGAVRAVRP